MDPNQKLSNSKIRCDVVYKLCTLPTWNHLPNPGRSQNMQIAFPRNCHKIPYYYQDMCKLVNMVTMRIINNEYSKFVFRLLRGKIRRVFLEVLFQLHNHDNKGFFFVVVPKSTTVFEVCFRCVAALPALLQLFM